MMLIHRKILVFACIAWAISPLHAQKQWSLEQCIDFALSHNVQIKQQGLNLDLANSNLWQSKMTLLPSINGGATHVYNYGTTVDRFTNKFATTEVQSNNFYLNASVVIFNGFQLLNTVIQSRLNLQAASLDVEKMKNDVALNVATAYLNTLFAVENLENAKNQLDISVLQSKRTEKLFEAESISKGDLLNLKAQVTQDEVMLIAAQNALDMAYLTLKQMINLPVGEIFEIEKPFINLTPEKYQLYKPEQILNAALQNQPDIKSAEIKMESATKGIAIARGGRYPSVNLQGSYGTGYSGASQEAILPAVFNGFSPIGFTGAGDTVYSPDYTYNYRKKPFNDQIKDNISKSIGLYVNIPLFNGWRVNSEVKRAKINALQASLSLQLSKDLLSKSIQQAYADAQAALKKYEAGSKSVEAMEESFKYAQQKFEVGMLNAVVYNDAKSKLFKAQSDLLLAKYEFIFKTKVIDFYLGKPITLK